MKFIKNLKSLFSHSEVQTANIVKLPSILDEQVKRDTNSPETVTSSDKERETRVKECKRRKAEICFQFSFVFMLMVLVVTVMLTFYSHKEKSTENFAELSEELSSIQGEYESLAEKVDELEVIAANEYEGKTTDTKRAVDDKSVYYGISYKDLWCDYEADDEAISLLSGISKIQYGTVGCSLQMMARGVDFITLSQMSSAQWEGIPKYLKTLTPVQLDYLSFRILDAYHFAQAVINREGLIADIESMGIAAETYENCTELQTIRFLSYMFTLFEENGVNYEWEEYDVLSLFN